MKSSKNRQSLLVAAILLLGVGSIIIFTLLLWLARGQRPMAGSPTVMSGETVRSPVPEPTLTATLQPTATSEPTPTATATLAGPVTYVVAAGDTLSGIALRFQVSLESLKNVNQLVGDNILVGQRLIIPIIQAAAIPTAALAENEYIVKTGDTLESIAAAMGTTVKSLREANFMVGDSILPGQKIIIPNANTGAPAWYWSVMEGNRTAGYPYLLEKEKFSLRYQENSFTWVDPEAVAMLVQNALDNVQSIFKINLSGRFTAYAAGNLFEPPNQYLRGRSFSSARETLFLYDGTGDPADQQYIIAHELTHLYMWNTFGVPSSVMISEGAAVYSGMNAISTSEHLPLKNICKLLYDAGSLPNIAGNLGYSGHNYDLANYYTAGCFAGYLSEKYSPSKVGEVYPNSNYLAVFGKNLEALENDFEATIAIQPVVQGIDPVAFAAQMEKMSRTYRGFFPSFSPSPAMLEQYRLLDHARLELLKGNLAQSDQYLTLFQQP